MSRTILFSVLFFCLFVVSALAVPLHTAPKNVIPDKYIVVFKTDASQEDRDQHISKLMSLIENQKGAALLKSYKIGDSFHAYHAKLPKSILKELLEEDHVLDFIEADSMMFANQETCYFQRGATWGLDRINNRALNLDNTYTYQVTNTAVDAFIVDTGIYIQHKDFNGRAIWGANFAGDNQNTDCNGHGTHVSGTVGSTTYGVSKNVTLIAVKVLGCDGSGTNSGVIEGIQFVTNNKKKGKPAVANMSLGGSKSTALNAAVNAAVNAGVVFVVAAGNENQDACNTSPASAASAISTGATTVSASGTTQIDQRASFSNFGTCVDIFAPGQSITSTWIGSPTAIETISGTSMASPHVAGAAAVYLESVNPSATPAQVASALVSGSTVDLITLSCGFSTVCNNSPNRLLYVPCN